MSDGRVSAARWLPACLAMVLLAGPGTGGIARAAETTTARRQGLDPAVVRAMKAVEEAVPLAAGDANRPVFHFRPPARPMNDINGPIFWRGDYHVFYQHDPLPGAGKHWGHARSKDLVHWEHLPIALWPSVEKGETRCYSGTSVVNGRGVPMLFYTSIYKGYTQRPRPKDWSLKVWAATGDPDLVVWKKHPDNPIVSPQTHGPSGDGYDPFIFQESGRTFMVLTTGSGINILEARNPELTQWTARGTLVRRPPDATGCWECPNFFKLDGRWVLLYSPSPRPVEYFVGSLDVGSLRFTPQQHGILDYGHDEKGRFGAYATNVLFDDRGRCVLFAWVSGFREPRGWNGCMTLPRVLSLAVDGRPVQRPAPELEKLRRQPAAVHLSGVVLDGRARDLKQAAGDTLEILATFEPGTAAGVGLRLRRSGDGRRAITIRHDGRVLDVAGTRLEAPPDRPGGTVTLHVFLDKTVVEVFAAEGRACATRVVAAGKDDLGVEVFAEGGRATIASMDVWKLRPIW